MSELPQADPDVSPPNRANSRRNMKPVYLDLLPLCNDACPAGENVQAWLSRAKSGDYESAWRILTQENPMPACMGRVCYHPCENACNRTQFDSPVGINSVERFLGDEALAKGWQFEKPEKQSGKRVLVVGAGPSGLSAAYHLRKLGHEVVLQDAGPKAGGMMRFGIPKYRLPREVLDAEIQRIVDMGVELKLNAKVDKILDTMKAGKFDAVFLAVGAHIAKRTDIPAVAAAKIVDALTVLRSMEGEENPLLGRKVIVYGGGNTALDVARTAKRLGASESIIVYRRNREKMPAHDFEVQEALEEGVLMKWLSTIKRFDDGQITVEKMKLDETGFPQPTGEYETLEADSVVLALGQDVDLSLLDGVPDLVVKDGVVQVGSNMMTGAEGIFAGGDMVPSKRTVTISIGHGKKAARNIDAWLGGESYTKSEKHELAAFNKLHTSYYSETPRKERPMIDIAHRQTTFDEVVQGLDAASAKVEANRCFSCGNCFECGSCYSACPQGAIVQPGVGKLYQFDYENCNSCNLCVKECPCGAIAMVPK